MKKLLSLGAVFIYRYDRSNPWLEPGVGSMSAPLL